MLDSRYTSAAPEIVLLVERRRRVYKQHQSIVSLVEWRSRAQLEGVQATPEDCFAYKEKG